MSASPGREPDGVPRARIVVEPRCRYGATIFVNQAGGVSIEQVTDYDGTALLVLEVDEAEEVARAILEVAVAARASAKEADDAD
jgi:hypothetical protein